MLLFNNISPDFDDGDSNGDAGEDDGDDPNLQEVFKFKVVKRDDVENVRETEVTLKPEHEVRFHRGLNNEGDSHWERCKI